MRLPLARRSLLGAELPPDLEAFDTHGMRVAGVVEDSVAARAGLAAGDIVHTIAALPVRSLAELAAALRRAGTAETTTIEYLRDGAVHTVEVDVEPLPHEPRATYDALAVAGATLRTVRTHADTPRALVVFIQGIACESIEFPLADDAPLRRLVDGWTCAGFDTLRFDKRGVGDSTGAPCTQTDFATELADARAVLAHAAADATSRGLPLFVCGHSVGGIITAQLAPDVALAGVIVYGTPVMRWLACLQDSARRQLALRGASEAAIAAQVAELARLAETGELNGRSAAYHAQLDTVDSESAWRRVTAPVLVVRGEHDWVVDAADQARIASLARGPTTITDVRGLDHLFGHHVDREASLRDYGEGAFHPGFLDATIAWLEARV